MPAIPRQKISKAVHRCQCKMKGIIGCLDGQRAVGNQPAGKLGCLVIDVYKRNALHQRDSRGRGLRITSFDFAQHNIGYEQVKV